MEVMEDYRYLGNRLGRRCDTEAHYRKRQSGLRFFGKPGSFSVCSRTLHLFRQSVVASATFFAAICWGSSSRKSNFRKLKELIKKAGLCAGGCCGAPGVGRGEDDAKQAAQHKGRQHKSPRQRFHNEAPFDLLLICTHYDVVAIYGVYIL